MNTYDKEDKIHLHEKVGGIKKLNTKVVDLTKEVEGLKIYDKDKENHLEAKNEEIKS